MAYWLAWEEPRAVGDLVHVEKFFARSLGGLTRARTCAGPAREGNSRTPSMYADEKSDEVVVPRKRPPAMLRCTGGGRGRDEDCSSPPAQIPACAANAPGSSLGSNVGSTRFETACGPAPSRQSDRRGISAQRPNHG